MDLIDFIKTLIVQEVTLNIVKILVLLVNVELDGVEFLLTKIIVLNVTKVTVV